MGEGKAPKNEKKGTAADEKHSTTSSEIRRLSHETKSTVSDIIRSEEIRLKAKEEAQQAIEAMEHVDNKTRLARTHEANHFITLENKVLSDYLMVSVESSRSIVSPEARK